MARTLDVAVILRLIDELTAPSKKAQGSLQSLIKSFGVINKEAQAASRGIASFAAATNNLAKSVATAAAQLKTLGSVFGSASKSISALSKGLATSSAEMKGIGVAAGGANKSITSLGTGMKTLSGEAAALRGSFSGTFEAMSSGAASTAAAVRTIASAWKSVAAAASSAARAGRYAGAAGAIGTAAARSSIGEIAGAGAAGSALGRRGGGRGPEKGHGSGNLYGSVSPGGMHMGYHPSSNAAMIGGGALAYGIYKAAELDKFEFQMEYHSGLPYTDENDKKFHDLIQSAASDTGFSYHDIGEAATDRIRLLKGTPGKGLDSLAAGLRTAATEAMVKNTTVIEAMRAQVRLSHGAQQYSPDEIQKLMPMFGFLSTANPATLGQMSSAAMYALPMLQAQLHMDPVEVMFASTALARAGATSSKAGTWLRSAFERVLPPDPHTMDPKAYERKMYAYRKLGLVDKHDKSTVLDPTRDHPMMDKTFKIVRENSAKLPLEERNSLMRSVFGERGAAGINILMQPSVQKQWEELKTEMPDAEQQFKTFGPNYRRRSPIQKTRETWEDVVNVLSDVGQVVLPALVPGLQAFDAILKTMAAHMPSITPDKEDSFWKGLTKAGAAGLAEGAVPGAAAGGLVGAFGGFGLGALPGALLGAELGAYAGAAYESGKYIYNYLGSPNLSPISPAHAEEGTPGAIAAPNAAMVPERIASFDSRWRAVDSSPWKAPLPSASALIPESIKVPSAGTAPLLDASSKLANAIDKFIVGARTLPRMGKIPSWHEDETSGGPYPIHPGGIDPKTMNGMNPTNPSLLSAPLLNKITGAKEAADAWLQEALSIVSMLSGKTVQGPSISAPSIPGQGGGGGGGSPGGGGGDSGQATGGVHTNYRPQGGGAHTQQANNVTIHVHGGDPREVVSAIRNHFGNQSNPDYLGDGYAVG